MNLTVTKEVFLNDHSNKESAEAVDTVLVGDDTDLLVLLLFHAKPNNKYKILFAPEPKQNTKSRVWDIKQVKADLVVVVVVVWHHPVTGAGAPGDTGAPDLDLLTKRKGAGSKRRKRARGLLQMLGTLA